MTRRFPPNPFDFAHPVKELDLLVGREGELREINYYLDYARGPQPPVNLAILGPRAAGKTSLLNATETLARQKGMIPVRVTLDEGDTQSALIFFQKLFDAMIVEAFERGGFGGPKGPTHEEYLATIFGAKPTGDFPLLFPKQFAMAVSSDQTHAPVSERALKADLERIQAELGSTIVLIVDEANVLKASRALLQKLRNVLVGTPKFMLVLCGTPDLFPQMDEVFSPIARQFKKVMVDAFKDEANTRLCVTTPLRKAGLDPLRVLDLDTYRNVTRMHEVSGGRPYEINLLCHQMYRRLQAGKSARMQLDLEILEEARRQLEREHNVGRRPILAAVRSLEESALAAFGTFGSADGLASFDDLWSAEYTLNGSSNWTQERMHQWLDAFVTDGILAIEDGKITFQGDEFDRLYTTYFCVEKGVFLSYPPADADLDLYWWLRLTMWFRPKQVYDIGLIDIGEAQGQTGDATLVETLNAMSGVTDDPALLERRGTLVQDLYGVMVHHRDLDEVVMWRIRPRINAVNFTALFCGPPLQAPESRAEMHRHFELIQGRIKELGGSIEVEEFVVPVYRLNSIVAAMQASKNSSLLREMAATHGTSAIHSYIHSHDRTAAQFHADLAYRYGADLWPSVLNNIGYIFLGSGDRDRAREMLKRAEKAVEGDDRDEALVAYNLAILEAQSGNFDEALAALDRTINKVQGLDEEERKMAWLFVGSNDGKLRFDEVESPDLLVAARQTKLALERTLPPNRP